MQRPSDKMHLVSSIHIWNKHYISVQRTLACQPRGSESRPPRECLKIRLSIGESECFQLFSVENNGILYHLPFHCIKADCNICDRISYNKASTHTKSNLCFYQKWIAGLIHYHISHCTSFSTGKSGFYRLLTSFYTPIFLTSFYTPILSPSPHPPPYYYHLWYYYLLEKSFPKQGKFWVSEMYTPTQW